MKNVIPFITLLAIAQQSEYELGTVEEWQKKHMNENRVIEPEKWTLKLRGLAFFGHVLFFLPKLTRIRIGLFTLHPLEASVRVFIISCAVLKLRFLQKKGLKVIAIAGSFGKTSTKHILHHLFSESATLLITPESVNTELGISQVILKKLTPKHTLFFIELGEFYPGHIRQLSHFIQPDFGILTPLGRQHLMRFGSLEKIAETFHDLVIFFSKTKKILVSESYQKFYSEDLTYYGSKKASSYRIEAAKVSRAGTECTIFTPHVTKEVFTPLFGEQHAINLLPAFWLAEQLGIETKEILKMITTLPSISHRHEPILGANNVLVLDNGYNTNPDSAQESLKLLASLNASQRIIVTLGFVELGKESGMIHEVFGELLAHSVDYAGIIESEATQAILEGFMRAGGKRDHFITGKDQTDVLARLQTVIKPNAVILLEGGYRELYS